MHVARGSVLLLAFALVGMAAAGDTPAPLRLLQGRWKVERFRTDGKDFPRDLADVMLVEISGKALKVSFKGKVIGEAVIQKVDADKSPRQMDLLAISGPSRDKIDLQCYSLEKDRLQFWAYSGTKAQRERPTKVPDGTEPDVDLIVLRRDR